MERFRTRRVRRQGFASGGTLLTTVVLCVGLLGSCATEPMPEKEEGGTEEGDIFPPDREERGPWQQETRLAWSGSRQVTH